MASNNNGQCCVCGTSTAQRCSACSTAGLDLFFCSREHQKLVYFAHKQFCGDKAKPFRFPPLSPAEATEGAAVWSSSSALDELGEDSQKDLPAVMAVLQQPNPTAGPKAASVLCWLRRQISISQQCRLARTDPDNVHARFTAVDALPTLSSFASRLAERLNELGRAENEGFPLDEGWYIALMHQALVFAALRERYLKLEYPFSASSFFPSSTFSSSSSSSAPPATVLPGVSTSDSFKAAHELNDLLVGAGRMLLHCVERVADAAGDVYAQAVVAAAEGLTAGTCVQLSSQG
ncbi:hypothetical protein JCM6882_009723 [Rhodosporidiobolus microsporus]